MSRQLSAGCRDPSAPCMAVPRLAVCNCFMSGWPSAKRSRWCGISVLSEGCES